ncbi:MAG: hypothetical protein ACR2K6_11875 [Solirubrobacterales bacterium]
MQLLVTTTIGLILFVLCIGLDIGGTTGALLLLTVLLIGGTIRAYAPLIEWLRGPAADLDKR